ncbi:ArsR/SmtB family transcription factor [Gracilibacillus kekensis]|uniref:Transcriptional regulator, ArsR family n=1 Tax=Gracilibacillus kekensis TaxID=1027249 RepID=A0A1M7QGH5_9BACI|nr:transcriptional regulator, ArsR family [Gracilibacillus kekensis]
MLKKTDEKRDVFVAIADPTRRQLIRILADSKELPLHELTPHFQMGRTAVSKHLMILREADIVRHRKSGRESKYRLNPEPLQEVKDWLSFYEKFWKERAAILKNILEE